MRGTGYAELKTVRHRVDRLRKAVRECEKDVSTVLALRKDAQAVENRLEEARCTQAATRLYSQLRTLRGQLDAQERMIFPAA